MADRSLPIERLSCRLPGHHIQSQCHSTPHTYSRSLLLPLWPSVLFLSSARFYWPSLLMLKCPDQPLHAVSFATLLQWGSCPLMAWNFTYLLIFSNLYLLLGPFPELHTYISLPVHDLLWLSKRQMTISKSKATCLSPPTPFFPPGKLLQGCSSQNFALTVLDFFLSCTPRNKALASSVSYIQDVPLSVFISGTSVHLTLVIVIASYLSLCFATLTTSRSSFTVMLDGIAPKIWYGSQSQCPPAQWCKDPDTVPFRSSWLLWSHFPATLHPHWPCFLLEPTMCASSLKALTAPLPARASLFWDVFYFSLSGFCSCATYSGLSSTIVNLQSLPYQELTLLSLLYFFP